MLDIHTHILPGMDDGSHSLAKSIAMLEREALQGVHAVVLTPHYYADRESPLSFVQRRNAAEEELLAAMWDREDLPYLLMGAEVAFFDGMCRVEDLELLCIEGTRVMLIEMPFCKWNRRILGELEEIRQQRGIQPVLAHVERYLKYQPSGLIRQMSESGMWIQVNTSFILRWQTSWRALSMLKRGYIHFVASDCHGMKRRPPELGMAMKKIERKLGRKTMKFLRKNEKKLLWGMK